MADGDRRTARAYIGSFTAAGGPGIVAASVAAHSGALTVLGGAGGVPDPAYLALSPGGDTLYAVSETAEGAVAAYRVTGDRPELIGSPVPVDAGGPTHLSLFAGHVLTANYGSGSVTAVPVRPDGGSRGRSVRRTPAHRLGPAHAHASRARTPTRCSPTPVAAGRSASTSAPTRCGCAR